MTNIFFSLFNVSLTKAPLFNAQYLLLLPRKVWKFSSDSSYYPFIFLFYWIHTMTRWSFLGAPTKEPTVGWHYHKRHNITKSLIDTKTAKWIKSYFINGASHKHFNYIFVNKSSYFLIKVVSDLKFGHFYFFGPPLTSATSNVGWKT